MWMTRLSNSAVKKTSAPTCSGTFRSAGLSWKRGWKFNNTIATGSPVAPAASAPAPAPAGAALASHQEVLLLPLSPGAGEGALILDLVAQHYGLPTLSTDHNVNMTVWLLLALAVLLVFLLMIRCFCCSHDDGEELKSTRDVPRDTGRAERMLRQEVGRRPLPRPE
mmetsp:Transcript_65363/g.202456  ORF Transcript_65363/g.202456 Transcript_65363/m.202456 type:complete len:166 (+) Transcript_65363:215-712(+)